MVQVCEAFWFVSIYAVSALVLFGEIDWRLTLPLAGWVAIFVGILVYFVPRIRDRSTIVSEARSMMTGRLVDSYTNIQTVKLFAHAAREDGYIHEVMTDHTGKLRHETRMITLMNGAVGISNGLLIAGTMALAIWLWSRGDLTLGAIALTSGLTIRISTMSGWIMWTAINVFESMGTVQEGLETIARPNRLVDAPGAKALVVERGEIRFDRVRFHYGRDNGVIDDLSLTIAPGEKVGLVGRSGAGKSTLVNLLLRFYDLEGGRILIDGQDNAEVTQESLRRQIGLVTQDTSLLHRSIRDNIRYGRPHASEAEIAEAARLAHADAFIPELSDWHERRGYDAHVGERGVKLSGRPEAARRHRPGPPQGRADPRPRRGDQRAQLRGRGGDPGVALPADGRQDRDRHRPPPLDHRRHGPAGGDGPGRGGRDRHAPELLGRNGIYAGLWKRQSGGFLGIDAVAEAAE